MQVLYRKWRPKTFDEVVGQEHVVRTLRNALATGRVGHAYLFAGPRGTGKTTMARLLAKAVNCLAAEDERPCNECAICQAVNEARLLDLIEIDAASNTSVDDVRELRERIGFRPNQARFRVYVIDEVHMLSTSAFNALLKTLEEPPPHAMFVLATTRADKIPETVISRCQRFDFRRIPLVKIVERLKWIADQERIRADGEVFALIARQSTGCMRDAESLLQLLASYEGEEVTVAEAQAALGIVARESVFHLTEALASGDLTAGLNAINHAMDEGADPRQFGRQIVDHLRVLLLLRLKAEEVLSGALEETRAEWRGQANAFPSARALAKVVRLFYKAVAESRQGWLPQLPLEMAFVDAVGLLETETKLSGGPSAPVSGESPRPTHRATARPTLRSETSVGESRESVSRSASAGAAEQSPAVPSTDALAPPSVTLAPSSSPPGAPPAGTPTTSVRESAATYTGSVPNDGPLSPDVLRSRWPELLDALRPRNLSLEALMRLCKLVSVEDGDVVLGFSHGLHRIKVEEDQNRRVVEDVLSDLMGKRYRVQCVMMGEDRGGSAKHGSVSPDASPANPPTAGDGARSTIDQIIADDPLVRAAVEDLGAQVLRQSES